MSLHGPRADALSRRALLGLLCAGASGCTGQTLRYSIHSVYDDPTARATKGSPFRTGQIVLSEAPGPYGILFTLAPDRFFRFTHSALIVTDEHAEPFVYDMSAAFKPTLATTPEGSLFGGIRRTPLADYIGMHLYVEIFEPPINVDPNNVAAKVRELVARHVEFDAAWDFHDRRAMFCSEFVVEALAAGGAPIPPLVPLTRNRSLRAVLTWFGVRSSESLPAAALPRGRRVAGFAVWPKRAMAEAYLEAKRELYRRFTVDQNIGNLLELDRYEVTLRPPVAEFLDGAPKLFATAQGMPPEAEMRTAVRALAERIFGVFQGDEV
jgi:hypothetical protein